MLRSALLAFCLSCLRPPCSSISLGPCEGLIAQNPVALYIFASLGVGSDPSRFRFGSLVLLVALPAMPP